MTASTEPVPFVDVPLTRDLRAVEFMLEDGSLALWVMNLRASASNYGCDCPDCAPHEQLGPLSREVKVRLGLVCGAGTHSGKPCGNLVRHPGERCCRHEEQAT